MRELGLVLDALGDRPQAEERPSWTSVWISGSDSRERAEAAMNVRSILSESTGSCCR